MTEPEGEHFFEYTIQSRLCAQGFKKESSENVSHLYLGETMPPGFIRRSFESQLWTLRAALARDLAVFARHCDMSFNTEPFVGSEFEQFYRDFAEGWWLEDK